MPSYFLTGIRSVNVGKYCEEPTNNFLMSRFQNNFPYWERVILGATESPVSVMLELCHWLMVSPDSSNKPSYKILLGPLPQVTPCRMLSQILHKGAYSCPRRVVKTDWLIFRTPSFLLPSPLLLEHIFTSDLQLLVTVPRVRPPLGANLITWN